MVSNGYKCSHSTYLEIKMKAIVIIVKTVMVKTVNGLKV